MRLSHKKNRIRKIQKKTFAIDIDNTICITHFSDYKNSNY